MLSFQCRKVNTGSINKTSPLNTCLFCSLSAGKKRILRTRCEKRKLM